jgi:hypothetical protein
MTESEAPFSDFCFRCLAHFGEWKTVSRGRRVVDSKHCCIGIAILSKHSGSVFATVRESDLNDVLTSTSITAPRVHDVRRREHDSIFADNDSAADAHAVRHTDNSSANFRE